MEPIRLRRVFLLRTTIRKKGFGVMDDRWPYPISQTMQRQTGSRIKPLRVQTPPTAPADGGTDATKPADGVDSIEPKPHCDVDPKSEN
jgi:hypothetical protein